LLGKAFAAKTFKGNAVTMGLAQFGSQRGA
jgi:hypothetical protein